MEGYIKATELGWYLGSRPVSSTETSGSAQTTSLN